MVPLTDKMAASLAGRESIQVKFVKDGESQNGSLSIINVGDQKVAQIELVNGMTRYAEDRFLEVELVINTQSGLKIPVSSIVEKEFYTVPREFLTLGDNGNSQGFIRETSSGDGDSTEFVEAAIYRQVDSQGNEITAETQDDSGGLCYVDMDTLNEGDVLLKPDSGKIFTVGKKITFREFITLIRDMLFSDRLKYLIKMKNIVLLTRVLLTGCVLLITLYAMEAA